MKFDSKELSIVISALVIQLVVPSVFPNLHKILDNSVLFAAPVNSFRSLKEGIFLLRNGLNPYSGTIIHHPPILVSLFTVINENELVTNLIYALADLVTALNLIRINEWFMKQEVEASNEKGEKIQTKQEYFANWIVYAWYFFNPLGITSIFSRSTTVFTNMFIMITLKSLCYQELSVAVMSLSVATYLSYHPWYYILPVVCYIIKSKPEEHPWKIVVKAVGLFVSGLFGLLYLSFQLTGSWQFLTNYETIVMFHKITPNLGLWWYFFTEIFQFFNNFFVGVFNLYTFIFIVPFTLRFGKTKRDLMFALWVSIGFVNFAKAYPTISDLSLFHCLVLEWKPLFKNLRINPVISYMLTYVLLALLPVFYYVWMELNSGNSNFFYAIGLVFSTVEAVFLSDFIWSKLCEEYGGARRDLTQI
ncbi:unnamed protein product [Kuraishia capsulata CBS 1993]|uniref:GPI transamidase subunit PIG-U n=1 Tax=Kuraishia capsulata CBS 1993 TaxID=1382522 RepID=W6MKN0_9ASCO|nr:uncharacterized protein KUCA_T00002535001 [Kuraishia capsulata CBS 1993]CDK26563.1 unnamed protein product [Kuraishia capsulata CBS 1993]